MGLISSKFAQKPQHCEEDETGSIPSTPILTPKGTLTCEKVEESGVLDPRSPSRHISRTPIQMVSLVAEQQSPTLHIKTDGAAVTETPLKNHLVLGIDPRSPSVELNRTPIIVDNTSPELPQKIKNKTLDKVRNGEIRNINPKYEQKVGEVHVTPKNKRGDFNKRKSLVLLETNIDYTETNLDDVIREKYPVEQLENLSAACCDAQHNSITECTESLVESSKSTENIQPDHLLIGTPKKIADFIEKCEGSSAEMLEECSDIIKEAIVVKDEIEISPGETKTETNDSLVAKSEPDFEITEPAVVEDTAQTTEATGDIPETKEIPSEKLEKPFQSISEPILKINLIADVKELDKKLTNLIYEDDDLVVCPKIVKDTGKMMQTRTPLGERQSVSENSKPGKLKVSDKPRRSQIPLFKDKKVKVQCENTPPRSMRRQQGAKAKKSQWDLKNDTLVI
ncbi:uncharacterized protein LOC126736691 [Anthonomus grandis grandis]|uniref:uncharacterized protein LOC126736691 n=1 Tax=Anthonomus grandis grandis TaxID=2921223 RepID=UPI0021669BDE|nr:uncharacterized protein LOC126736691 [Anthonomus grandis grandis]